MSGLYLLLALTLTSPSPLQEALAHFEQLDGYRLALRSEGPGGNQHLLYAYRKPGWVRMDVLSPYAGAVLIYSPVNQHIRLWPFGLSWPEHGTLAGYQPSRSPGRQLRCGGVVAECAADAAVGPDAGTGGSAALGAVSMAPGGDRGCGRE